MSNTLWVIIMVDSEKAFNNYKKNSQPTAKEQAEAREALRKKSTIGSVVYVPSGKHGVNDYIRDKRPSTGPFSTQQIFIRQQRRKDAFGQFA